MRRQTGRQADRGLDDRETGRQADRGLDDRETGRQADRGLDDRETGRQGDRGLGGYLQSRVAVGVGDVDLQPSKVGVIIVAKVKCLNAYREGCGHRAGVRGYIKAYLTWST